MPDLAALVAAAVGRKLTPADRFAVAVSGGPDSLALLAMAATAFPVRLAALTVDHQLRPASGAEAHGVAAICQKLGVPHQTLAWTGIKPRAGMQAAARAARYSLMGDWCAAAGYGLLLTGHHADDQAETLLMRLARSGGTAGLAGIRAARPLQGGVMLVRPLLGQRRSTLANIVADCGWTAIEDPSNVDTAYARTKIRTLLATQDVFDVPHLVATARHLESAEAALEWAVARAWAGGAVVTPRGIDLDVTGLPDDLVRRLVLRAVTRIASENRPVGNVMQMITQLVAGKTATLAGVQAKSGAIWQFSAAPPRRKATINVGGARQNRTG